MRSDNLCKTIKLTNISFDLSAILEPGQSSGRGKLPTITDKRPRPDRSNKSHYRNHAIAVLGQSVSIGVGLEQGPALCPSGVTAILIGDLFT